MKVVDIINEEIQKFGVRTYHGTPFKSNAMGIMKNGLRQKGDFKTAGGVGSESMQGRSYLSKELWNSVRYSFIQPSNMVYSKDANQDWLEYIKHEPYGYLFVFELGQEEMLPDEDAIGAGVGEYLNGRGNQVYQKYIQGIDKNLLTQAKKGNFKAFADIGKIIEPQLSPADMQTVVNDSQTLTVNKPIMPTEVWQIPKPNVKFFKTIEEYIEYFNKYAKRIK
jgi:hypothetical protein